MPTACHNQNRPILGRNVLRKTMRLLETSRRLTDRCVEDVVGAVQSDAAWDLIEFRITPHPISDGVIGTGAVAADP